MEQAALKRLALPNKTPLPILFFGSVPVPFILFFGSLGYGVIGPSYLVFLALSSSEDKTMVYSVNKIIVNKTVNEIIIDKEVDSKVVKQEVFKRVLLAKKLVIGFNKLLPLRILIASNL